MADIKLAGTLVPYDLGATGDPSHISKYGLGGLKQFVTIEQRDANGSLRASTGSIAYVKQTNKYYMWSSSAWIILPTFDPQFRGTSWKYTYKLTSAIVAETQYTIQSGSIRQIPNFDFLSVYINGDILACSKSDGTITNWDYTSGSSNNLIKFKYNIPADEIYITYQYPGGE